MKNDLIDNVLTRMIVKFHCSVNKLKIQTASSEEDLKAVNEFVLKKELEFNIKKQFNQTSVTINSNELAHCFYITKRGEILGTVSLFDTTERKPLTEYLFKDDLLCYNPKCTFSMEDVVICQSNEKESQLFLMLLLHKCKSVSKSTKRTNWLICSDNKRLSKIKNICGEVKILGTKSVSSYNNRATDSKIKNDTPQGFFAFIVNANMDNFKKSIRQATQQRFKTLMRIKAPETVSRLRKRGVYIQ